MRLMQILMSAIILISCGEVKRLDTSKIKEQMGNYKVKQIRPDEMITQVRKLGEAGERRLGQNIHCASIESTVDSLSKVLRGSVELVDLSELSLEDSNDEKEKMLYEAYLYAFEQNEKLPSNAQKLANGTFVYSFGANSESILCDTLLSPNRYFWKMTWTQQALVQSF